MTSNNFWSHDHATEVVVDALFKAFTLTVESIGAMAVGVDRISKYSCEII